MILNLVGQTYKANKDYQFPEIIDNFKKLMPGEAMLVCLTAYDKVFNDLKTKKYPDFEVIYELMHNYKKIKASKSGQEPAFSHDELLKFLADISNLGLNSYGSDESRLLEAHLKRKDFNF